MPGCCAMVRAPSGTSAWRRLLAGMSRPARAEHRPDRAPRSTGSVRSSTPMTSAITSRVMSSWVGPSPPHTSTASLRASAGRSASAMRSALSPTFTWKYESMPASASCSPIHDELVSTICPSSSSVPTATTSQRMGAQPGWSVEGRGSDRTLPAFAMVVAAARPTMRYCRPLSTATTTEAHSSVFATHWWRLGQRRHDRGADRQSLQQGLQLAAPRRPARPGPAGPSRPGTG